MIVSRISQPFAPFCVWDKGTEYTRPEPGSLCSCPWAGRGTRRRWSCHCLVPIISLTKPCSDKCLTDPLNLYFGERTGSNKKRELSGVCFEDAVLLQTFLQFWHFAVARMENVNVKVCIFSMDHQVDLKSKSTNLPATEIFLVNFFSLHSSGTAMKSRMCIQYCDLEHNQCNLRLPLGQNLSKCDFI